MTASAVPCLSSHTGSSPDAGSTAAAASNGAPTPLRFFHRGRWVAVDGAAPPTRSVLQWLREDAHACGTKEGCAEGDCGACTVIVAELDDNDGTTAATGAVPNTNAPASAHALPGAQPPQAWPPHPALPGPLRTDGLLLRTVNACIRFLPTLHGKALLTVEDLASPAAAGPCGATGHAAQPAATIPAPVLHPAQAALVAHHGSQCGFCTPGFVMTLAAVHDHHRAAGTRPGRPEMADALAGNLCRCTGYRPILDAGQAMFDAPDRRLPLAGVANALRQFHSPELAPERAPKASQAPLPTGDGAGAWNAPRTLAELAALRLAKPEARLLAGGTDIGLWVNKQFRELGDILWLGDVTELRQMHTTADGGLRIGAAVPLQDAWGALAARWPALVDLARRFAGPPVRHAGTLCGNLANGSPIGDAAPALMALGARLVLRRGLAQREVPLDGFYLDYMKNQLAPGEFIEAVCLPPPDPAWLLQCHKLSKRFDCDISALSAGFALKLAPAPSAASALATTASSAGPASPIGTDGPSAPSLCVADVRLVFGGMAATVRRAVLAEAALRGQPWTQASVRAAQAALAQDFRPLSDLRASAAYRRRTAAALLQRLWLAHRPGQALPPQALDVHAATGATA